MGLTRSSLRRAKRVLHAVLQGEVAGRYRLMQSDNGDVFSIELPEEDAWRVGQNVYRELLNERFRAIIVGVNDLQPKQRRQDLHFYLAYGESDERLEDMINRAKQVQGVVGKLWLWSPTHQPPYAFVRVTVEAASRAELKRVAHELRAIFGPQPHTQDILGVDDGPNRLMSRPVRYLRVSREDIRFDGGELT